jgi:hypothetical protein
VTVDYQEQAGKLLETLERRYQAILNAVDLIIELEDDIQASSDPVLILVGRQLVRIRNVMAL